MAARVSAKGKRGRGTGEVAGEDAGEDAGVGRQAIAVAQRGRVLRLVSCVARPCALGSARGLLAGCRHISCIIAWKHVRGGAWTGDVGVSGAVPCSRLPTGRGGLAPKKDARAVRAAKKGALRSVGLAWSVPRDVQANDAACGASSREECSPGENAAWEARMVAGRRLGKEWETVAQGVVSREFAPPAATPRLAAATPGAASPAAHTHQAARRRGGEGVAARRREGRARAAKFANCFFASSARLRVPKRLTGHDWAAIFLPRIPFVSTSSETSDNSPRKALSFRPMVCGLVHACGFLPPSLRSNHMQATGPCSVSARGNGIGRHG